MVGVYLMNAAEKPVRATLKVALLAPNGSVKVEKSEYDLKFEGKAAALAKRAWGFHESTFFGVFLLFF